MTVTTNHNATAGATVAKAIRGGYGISYEISTAIVFAKAMRRCNIVEDSRNVAIAGRINGDTLDMRIVSISRSPYDRSGGCIRFGQEWRVIRKGN